MPKRTGGQKMARVGASTGSHTHTHTARTQGSQGQGCGSSSSPTCDLSASCGVGSNSLHGIHHRGPWAWIVAAPGRRSNPIHTYSGHKSRSTIHTRLPSHRSLTKIVSGSAVAYVGSCPAATSEAQQDCLGPHTCKCWVYRG